MELWAMSAAGIGGIIIVIGLFVRIEHRMTKVETTLSIVAGRLGLCQPNLGKDIQ